jgi:hypothetical protein
MGKDAVSKGAQSSLASFFSKKPAASTAAPAAAGASTPSGADAPALAGKRVADAPLDDSSAKRAHTTPLPATEAPTKQLPSAGDKMGVEHPDDIPLSAIGRKAATSMLEAADKAADDMDTSEDDEEPIAARKGRAPAKRPPAKPAKPAKPAAPAPARPAAAATPAARKEAPARAPPPSRASVPSPPLTSPPTGEAVKTVSFGFLRDRRDGSGRRPGDAGYDKTTLQVRLAKDERFTPGQEQYWAIKKLHADCIIAFKMGKFYELFEEDALIGHRELDLAFMGKGAPHAGFPEAALPKCAKRADRRGSPAPWQPAPMAARTRGSPHPWQPAPMAASHP